MEVGYLSIPLLPKARPRYRSAFQLLAASAAEGNTEQIWAATPALPGTPRRDQPSPPPLQPLLDQKLFGPNPRRAAVPREVTVTTRACSMMATGTGSKFTVVDHSHPHALLRCCLPSHHRSVPIPALLCSKHPPLTPPIPNSGPRCFSLASQGRICLFGRPFPSFHIGFFG